MSTLRSLTGFGIAALLAATPALAQQNGTGTTAAEPAAKEDSTPSLKSFFATQKKVEIQNFRHADKRGLNVFETPKDPGVAYTGFKLDWGAAFTQQFQGLRHENSAVAVPDATGANKNELAKVGNGFNNATANLNLNVQLAPGIRVALSSYLSSRHHNETWVKDGFLLIDASPIDYAPLHKLMEYVTVRAGHYEINYGDAHFRRSDNGNALYNPFVGNLILDAFTTQIGGEVYVRSGSLLAMGAVSGGEVRGQVRNPQGRSPAYYGKVGVDKQLSKDLRVRLTGSTFQQERSLNQTLYSGDRAGSRYYSVLDNATSTEANAFTSGLVNPAFNKVTAYMVNPFVKYQGLELFGVIEQSKGKGVTEEREREFTQYATDVVYRFGADERLYLGGRYNTVDGRLPGMTTDIGIDRTALGAGWFITPSVLMKGEWVNQKYDGFAPTDIRSGGKFKGFVVEGVVAF